MSIPFSDTTNYKGLVQFYEKECGFERGDISGDANKLKEFAAEVNLAVDDFFTIAIPASGKWKIKDSNHTGESEILANIVSGTRKYSILIDAASNLTLEIFKVFAKTSSDSQYQEIYPYDPKSQSGIDSFTDGLNQQGIPNYYKKEGMDVYFDLIPNYNSTNGLKVLVSQEGSYFTSADTTKKPGVPGIFHRWFFLKPSQNYLRIHSMGSYQKVTDELDLLEEKIRAFFGARAQDEKHVLRGVQVPFM